MILRGGVLFCPRPNSTEPRPPRVEAGANTQLATKAGATAERSGHTGAGITAYNFAYQIWQMPQAIITVSVMTAVLPRISRAAQDGDTAAVRDDLSYGLRTSAVAIVPCAFAFLALGVPMATLLYAGSGTEGAQGIGYVLMAFGLGLIPYSAQYVILRGLLRLRGHPHALLQHPHCRPGECLCGRSVLRACSPALAVAGMAASYRLAVAIGSAVAWRRLRRQLGGDLDGPHILRTYARLTGAAAPAAPAGGSAAWALLEGLGNNALGSLVALLAGAATLLGVFVGLARLLRIHEFSVMVAMIRGRLGR